MGTQMPYPDAQWVTMNPRTTARMELSPQLYPTKVMRWNWPSYRADNSLTAIIEYLETGILPDDDQDITVNSDPVHAGSRCVVP